MIRVGVLEDEQQYADELVDHLSRYSKERGIKFQTQLFTDGDELLDYDYTIFDIIFFDIQVPAIDGLSAAKIIRGKSPSVVIIFLTRLAQYAVHGYEVDALDYLIKPIDYRSLEIRLDKAMGRIERHLGGKVTLRTNREIVCVDISEIYYIEANKHKTIYHTSRGDYPVWQSFSSARSEFEPKNFAQCHGSYLCNLEKVTGVNGGLVYMGDMSVGMSRGCKKQFMDQLMLYWAG